jgi:enoyl-CoA hydratase/carnithine racemase
MTDLSNERVRCTITDGVADVRMIRVDKMNALDEAMFNALRETGARLCKEPGLRAVVLSGEGRAFCAGLDMGRFATMADGANKVSHEMRLGTRTHGLSNAPQYTVMVWQDVPVPVIAAVHGVALGGGFQLCLGADIRLVTPDVKMSILEIKWGLVPDMGGVYLMQGLARADVIRELTYTGRMFSGTQALEYGFATKVCADPYVEAMAMARDIAQKSPHAIRANKRLLKVGESGDVARILQAESDEQIGVMGGGNPIKAVRAGIEKRVAKFLDV